MKKVVIFSVILVVFSSLLVASATSAAVTLPVINPTLFEATPLNFTPTAINNQGVVIGWRYLNPDNYDDRRFETVRWEKGQLSSLGTFGYNNARPLDINDQGSLLLEVESVNPVVLNYLLVQPNGNKNEIAGTVDGGHVFLYRLNNLNQVVGYTSSQHGPSTALIWHPSYKVAIEHELNSWLVANNNLGQAVGYAPDPNNPTHLNPILWDNGVWPLESTDLVCDINDQSQVVGSYNTDATARTPNAARPGLWRNGQLHKLISLGLWGFATNINNRGTVLGFLDSKPVFWNSPGAKPIFISNLVKNLKVTNVTGLNDQNQILAEAERPDGTHGYFLIQPRRK
ncbi:MAG: hypothetical protein US94_C0023G0001 [Berkelbacteria bacterium GW2011_GWB1_38_5]|uniref:Uncharacterized protein n=2 Tax=Candidatus Berkelbacteria TaxID=1618330 RepID=A0A0G0I379_9BACT|nr:MAG: hypothetical protein US31_C0002G0054 [Berkelbacteria bacterium GW2011_GWA1_36_9]KKQ73841.1 MAG: hypothetical protein US94_C0023G0001 [Berkelbacteria bacterium GW2011_GWB1_38_5]